MRVCGPSDLAFSTLVWGTYGLLERISHRHTLLHCNTSAFVVCISDLESVGWEKLIGRLGQMHDTYEQSMACERDSLAYSLDCFQMSLRADA